LPIAASCDEGVPSGRLGTRPRLLISCIRARLPHPHYVIHYRWSYVRMVRPDHREVIPCL
jgi:hypothetical protein